MKNITVRLDDKFHQKIKIKMAMQCCTMQEYIVKLIEQDLKKTSEK